MTRRDNGEGTITQRTDGSWAVALSCGKSPDGKRIRKQATCKTKKEAQAKLKEWRAAKAQGVDVTKDNMTVSNLIDSWWDNKQNRLRQTTLKSYEQLVRLHIRPALGHLRVVDTNAMTLDRFFIQKEKEGLGVSTIGYLRRLLHGIFEQAMLYDIVSRNVVQRTQAIKESDFEGVSLTYEQVKSLLSVLPQDSYGVFVTVCLGLGVRPAEARGLRWQDIHFAMDDSDTGHVTVSQQIKDEEKGHYLVQPPKTKKGTRPIPMPTYICTTLKSYGASQTALIASEQAIADSLGIKMERPSQWSDLVFQGSEGLPLPESYTRKKFKQYLKAAGLGHNIRLYDLRHTYNSLLSSKGVTPEVRRDLMGHSTTFLVKNTYSHTLPTSLCDAAEVMNNILRGVA